MDHVSDIEDCTGIPRDALLSFVPEKYSIAQKMAWAAGRHRAYSLLGILGVSLGLIPGEGGEQAFLRLQEKLIRKTNDTSIFAWNKTSSAIHSHWLLAPSPDSFEGCHIYREYRSCGTGVMLDKTALTGTFDTRIDCFDVTCACLGHFRTCSDNKLPEHFRDKRAPVQRNAVGKLLVETNTGAYRRVILNGKQCVLFDLHSQQGLRSIESKSSSICPVPSEALFCDQESKVWLQRHGDTFLVRPYQSSNGSCGLFGAGIWRICPLSGIISRG